MEITDYFSIVLENPFKSYMRVCDTFKRPHIYFQWYRANYKYYAKILDITLSDVDYKYKYDTISWVGDPSLDIILFRKIHLKWTLSWPWDMDNDRYWEQLLWTLYESEKNVVKARATWPWRDNYDLSTWKNYFIKNGYSSYKRFTWIFARLFRKD
jgi:hypothetical protein